MDTVLGVSMAPTAVRMVLVEGENADGVTVDEDGFDVNAAADAPTINAADQVVSAILGTQEGAAESGYQVRSTGVTWTDPIEAAALRDALAARKVENVMLVSSFLAAAALAQVVGSSVGYAQTGPAVRRARHRDAGRGQHLRRVDHRRASPAADARRDPDRRAGQRWCPAPSRWTTGPTVCSSSDPAWTSPRSSRSWRRRPALIVNAPEEPETALARGAALASANAPLFSSSTAALAYAQDPGTGFINPYAVAPGYFDVATDNASGEQALAYSAVADDDARRLHRPRRRGRVSQTGTYTGAYTGIAAVPEDGGRRPLFLVASAVAAIFVVGAAALLVALAISMRPTAAVRPEPGHNAVAPKPAPAAPAAPAPASLPRLRRLKLPPRHRRRRRPRRNRLHRLLLQLPPAPAPAPAAPAPEPAGSAACPAPVAPAPAPPPAGPVPIPIPIPMAFRRSSAALGPRWISRRRRIPGWWRIPRWRGDTPAVAAGYPGGGGGHGGVSVAASAAAMVAGVTVASVTDLACLAWVFNLRRQTVI